MTNYDYWASHSFLGSSGISEKAAVDYLLKDSPSPYADDVSDLYARVALSALALLGDKEYARTGTRREPGGLSELYKQPLLEKYLQERLAQCRDILEPALDMAVFPVGGCIISFRFTLSSPYLSQDDAALHLLDNPVKKEWVFKLPYVAPTQWKGALRAAMIRQLIEQLNAADHETSFTEVRLQLYHLFGNEKDGAADFLDRALAHWRVGPAPENADGRDQREWQERVTGETQKIAQEFDALLRERGYRQGDVEGFQGCLYFYPTYFTRLGLEVINPHDRKTGAGRQPIYFECVPAGAAGDFTLLYAPLNGAAQAADDLTAVAQGIQAMLTIYGFGAKTSSGFGVASDWLDGKGKLTIRAELGIVNEPATPVDKPDVNPIQTEVEAFVRRFDLEEFPYWTNEELEQSEWGRSRKSKYKRLRARHPDWDDTTRKWQGLAVETQPEPEPLETLLVSEYTFRTLSELCERARDVAEELREGGEV